MSRLPIEHQRFIEMFVLASGSLKEIAAHAGVSYPTVRNRLDKVIDSLRQAITTPSGRDVMPTETFSSGKGKKQTRGADLGATSSGGPSAAEIIKQIT